MHNLAEMQVVKMVTLAKTVYPHKINKHAEVSLTKQTSQIYSTR